MKRKTMISSILVIVLCLGLISGSTFALFTSENSVNIAVTSGKVKVNATLSTPILYSANASEITTDGKAVKTTDTTSDGADGTLTGTFAGTYYYDKLDGTTFADGGTASYTAPTLTIDKMTPGDKVKTTLSVGNESNVAIQYRLKIEATSTSNLDVLSLLKIDYDGKLYTGLKSFTSSWTLVPAPTSTTDPMTTKDISIIFPLDVDGEEYMDKTVGFVFTVEAVQSNANTSGTTTIEFATSAGTSTATAQTLTATAVIPTTANATVITSNTATTDINDTNNDATTSIPVSTTLYTDDAGTGSSITAGDGTTGALSRTIDVVPTSPTSTTVDISFTYTETNISTQASTTTAVTGFDKIVTNTANIGANLMSVTVTRSHNGQVTSMNPSDDPTVEGFSYDPATGILTIRSKLYSAYGVNYVPAVVKVISANVVTYYETLKKAFDAVTTTDIATIELLNDITIDESLTLEANKTATLILAGKTIDTTVKNAIVNRGTLTVDATATDSAFTTNAGNVFSNETDAVITLKGGSYTSSHKTENVLFNNGTMNIDGITLVSEGAGIHTNGALTIETASITAGDSDRIEGYKNCIYAGDNATVLIKDGTYTYRGNLTGNTLQAGGANSVFTINDGTFSSLVYDTTYPKVISAENATSVFNINGGTWVGDCGRFGHVNITGGHINFTAIYDFNSPFFTLTGGIYADSLKSTLNKSIYISSAYEIEDNGDGTWVINEAPVQAKHIIGTQEELQTVFAATIAEDNLTINISDDIVFEGENWTPLNLEAYNQNTAKNVRINGNGHTISGLNDALIANAFFGNTSIEIYNLTLKNTNILNKSYNGLGNGAFIAYADNCNHVTLVNCHLKDSSIEINSGSGVGGLIGSSTTSPLIITNCSVTNSTIKGSSSNAGAIIGLAGYAAASITDVTATNCTIKGERADKSGYIVGSVMYNGAGGATITTTDNCTGNTVINFTDSTENNTAIYGRSVGMTEGTFRVNGVILN